MIFVVAIFIGLAIVTLSIYQMYKEDGKFKYLNNYKESRFIRNAKRSLKLNFKKANNLSKKELMIILAIAVLMASTTKQLVYVPKYLFWGLVLGLIFVKLIGDMKNRTEKTKKLKEISTLFEAVELYSKAGYTVYQSLKAARLLTNSIRPYLDKCLETWGSSPQKALELLQEELKLPESEVLVLLLIHMEVVGSKEMQGIMKREANNIDRLEKMRNQISISNKPLILMIYRMLPLVSILGITVGSLLYRTYSVLTESGIF